MDFQSSDIPWEIVTFVSIFAFVLYILIFFMSYLTGAIYRRILRFILPDSMAIKFQRLSFSVASGHITIHDLKFKNLQMIVRVKRVCLSLRYWKKIPNFETGSNCSARFFALIDGVQIVLYNKSLDAIQNMEKIIDLFNQGKSTEDVTEFVKNLYPAPQPYRLSIFMKMILPVKFKVHSLSVIIGNPHLPSRFQITAKKIKGSYTILPRKTPQHSLKQSIDADINELNIRSIPNLDYDQNNLVKGSMKKLNQRFQMKEDILKADLNVKFIKDAWGCYIRKEDENSSSKITNEPEMLIEVEMDNFILEYGPYTDKVRSAFMKFFMPFQYTNPIIYPESPGRIKKCEVSITFKNNGTIRIPFYTNQKLPETLIVNFDSTDSNIKMCIPQSISSYNENVMTVECLFRNAKLSTSLKDELIINSNFMKIVYNNKYPQKWYETSMTELSIGFVNYNRNDASIKIAPYHIDFLTQLATDFTSAFPFSVEEISIFKFQPSIYQINLELRHATIELLSSPTPAFEQVLNIDNHPRIALHASNIFLNIQLPFNEFKPKARNLTFSGKIQNAKINFLLPENHVFQTRRNLIGKDDRDANYDSLNCEQIHIFGSYGWNLTNGNVHFPLIVKVGKLEGSITVFSFSSFLTTLMNYTTSVKKHPDEERINIAFSKWKQPISEHPDMITHSQITVQLVKCDIHMPFDLYDMNSGPYFHGSDIFISMEGNFPYWHLLLKAPAISATLTETNFPSETYFYQQMGDQSDKSETQGIVHVDGLLLTLKNCNVRSIRQATVNSLIAVDIGDISGYIPLHQLFNILDLVNNILFLWFSEDIKPKQEVNLDSIYLPSIIRVTFRSIQAFIDFGKYGLLTAILPSGISIYNDNLINNEGYSTFFINIPIIDVHHVIAEPTAFENGEDSNMDDIIDPKPSKQLCSILRFITFISIIRRVDYSEGAFDAKRQLEVLNELDDHKFIKWSHLPVHQLPDIKNNIFRNIDPKSLINEKYLLKQCYKTDPTDENKYVLLIPTIHYDTEPYFYNPDIIQYWAHAFMINRFSKHKISKIETKEINSERFARKNVNMNVIFPENILFLIKPPFIEIVPLLLKTVSLSPDCHFLSKLTRSIASDDSTPLNSKTKQLSLNIPGVDLYVVDSRFNISVIIGRMDIFTKTEFNEVSKHRNSYKIENSLYFSIYEILLSSSNVVLDKKITEEPSITLKIPYIQIAKTNKFASGNISKIDLDFTSPDKSSALINNILNSVFPFIGEFSSLGGVGKSSQFEMLLRSKDDFDCKIEKLNQMQYKTTSSPIVQPSTNALISAFYESYNQENIHDFVYNYKFYQIPSKSSKSNQNSLENDSLEKAKIKTKIIKISIGSSVIEIKINPIMINTQKNKSSIICSINSIKASLKTDLFIFLLKINIPKKENNLALTFPSSDASPQENLNTINDTDEHLILHITINNIAVSFKFLTLHLKSISFLANSSPSLSTSLAVSMTNFVITIGEFAQIVIGGFDIHHSDKIKSGIVYIRPIDILFSFDLFLNPKECLDLSFIDLLPKRERHSDINSENKINTSYKNKSDSKLGSIFTDFVYNNSLSLSIDSIIIKGVLDESTSISFMLPGFRGGCDPVGEKAISFYLYVIVPKIIIPEFFSFPLSSFLLHGEYIDEKKSLNLFGMIGMVKISAFQKTLVKLAFLINKILSRKPRYSTNQIIKRANSTFTRQSVMNNFQPDLYTSPHQDTRKNKSEKDKKHKKIQDNAKKLVRKSGFNLAINIFMPQLTIDLPDISSQLFIIEPSFTLSYSKQSDIFGFHVNVNKFFLNSYSSSIASSNVNIRIMKNNKYFYFRIDELTILLTLALFSHIEDLKNFFTIIKNEFTKQENVNSLIKGINAHIQNTVKNTYNSIFQNGTVRYRKMSLNDNSLGNINNNQSSFLSLPSITESKFLLELNNTKVTIELNSKGNTILTSQLISLMIETRKSPKHFKRSNAIKFYFNSMNIILDSSESQTHHRISTSSYKVTDPKKKKLSTIECKMISLTVLSFSDRITIDSEINGFSIFLFPTIPIVASHIFELIDHIFSFQQQKTPKVLSQKKRQKILNRRRSLREITSQLTIFFVSIAIKDFSINLNPITAKLPISLISIKVDIKKTSNSFARQKMMSTIVVEPIKSIISPQLIHWISRLMKNMKKSKLSGKYKQSVQQVKQIQLASQTAIKTKEKGFLSNLVIDLTLVVKTIEFELNCHPSDTHIVFGFNDLSLVFVGRSKSISFQLSDIYINTGNTATKRNLDLYRDSRLLSFHISFIMALLSKNSNIINIKSISISMSNDKVDDLFTLLNIWVNPLLDIINHNPIIQRSNPNNFDSFSSLKSPRSNENSISLEDFNHDNIYISNDDSETTKKKGGISLFNSNMKITIKVDQIEVIFAYSGAHGKLTFIISPVMIEKDFSTLIFTISTIKLNASGFLDGELTLNPIIIQFIQIQPNNNLNQNSPHKFSDNSVAISDDSLKFCFISIIGEIKCNFESGGDFMLTFRMKRSSLFFFFDPPYNQILSIVIGSPKLRMVSQAFSKFRNLLNSIIEPIQEGFIQTNKTSKQIAKRDRQLISSAKFPMKRAKLDLLLENCQVELFRYYITDKDAVKVTINGASLIASLQYKGEKTLYEMTFTFKPIQLLKLICDNGKVTENRNILFIPQISGDLNTSKEGLNVKYDFITDFKDSVETSLNLSDYESIMEIIKFAISQFKSNKKLNEDEEKKNGDTDINKNEPDEKNNNEIAKLKFSYVPGKYQFTPHFTISLGARITPNVEWVLARFGISDEHIIPSLLFEYVCLGLQKVLENLANSICGGKHFEEEPAKEETS